MFCITAARVLHVSLTREKTEKANGLQSIKIDRRWVTQRKQTYDAPARLRHRKVLPYSYRAVSKPSFITETFLFQSRVTIAVL